MENLFKQAVFLYAAYIIFSVFMIFNETNSGIDHLIFSREEFESLVLKTIAIDQSI